MEYLSHFLNWEGCITPPINLFSGGISLFIYILCSVKLKPLKYKFGVLAGLAVKGGAFSWYARLMTTAGTYDLLLTNC